MKVKILKKCTIGMGGNMHQGEEHDIPDRIAEKLINRGYAQAATAPKPKATKPKAPKKTNRAVSKVATPEDE